MRIEKTSSGSKKLVLSKSEWEVIGEKAGWHIKAEVSRVNGSGSINFRIIDLGNGQYGVAKSAEAPGDPSVHECSYNAEIHLDRAGRDTAELDCMDLIGEGEIPTSPTEISSEVWEQIWESLEEIALDDFRDMYSRGEVD